MKRKTKLIFCINFANIITPILIPPKMKEECDICGDLINKSNRKKIVCPFDSCKRHSCRACFNHFLKDCGVSPVCMWCKKDFSLDFIYENTTQKFYNEYMDHRTNVLLDRAKSELPHIQERADVIMRKNRYENLFSSFKDELYDISNTIFKIKSKLDVLYLSYGITKISPYMKKINNFNCNYWENWLEQFARCNLCDGHISKPQKTKTCNSCNLVTCETCFRMCLLVNDTKCVNCDFVMFEKNENIKDITIHSYYNKFFKKKQPQNTKEYKEISVDVKKSIKDRLKINNIYSDYCIKLYNTKYGHEPNNNEKKKKKKDDDVIKFIKKCPNENCRGFLSNAWKCGLCDTYFCHDCHKPKNGRNDEIHVCDEKEKATIQMLNKESKPCPKCGMPIERISGCAQVWTPCCKIAFNWNTGKIDPGRIHSPEYYEYLRRTQGEVPREREDMPCGGIVNFFDLRNALKDLTPDIKYKLDKYFQRMTHVNEVELNSLPQQIGQQDNTDLGVSYLTNILTEEKWKTTLKARIKKEEKNNNIYHILYMFVHVINDLFRNLILDKNTDNFFDNGDKIIKYSNEQIERINKRYKSKETKYFIRV